MSTDPLDPRTQPTGKLDITPEVERLTIGKRTEAIQRRADKPVEARPLSQIEITPRMLMCCAYVDSFRKRGWSLDRSYDVCRALGFKPQDIADAGAILRYRLNR